MAIFCFRTKDGELVERPYACGKAPQKIKLPDGRFARRSLKDELAGSRKQASHDGWPIECEASGVRPEQAGELKELLRKNGVPTEVSAAGNPIYRSPEHRRQALKVRGMHDRNGYY